MTLRQRFQPIVVFAFLCVPFSLLCGLANAAPSITLSKKSGPPTSRILVSGGGFEPNVGVDIFFDTKDKALVVTNGNGEFHDAGIYAPRSAYPGKHWVTALERNNDKGAQEPFLVQTDWSQFRFDADGTRLNPYENVLNPNTVESLALKWTYATGGYVWSSPAVANGVVYVGSDDGNIYALDASTGAKLWTYTTGGYVSSSPAVANGVVYVGSFDGNIYALDARTGVKLWNYQTDSYEDFSAPAVASGVVYVGTDHVYALNASTGTLLWSYTGDGVSSSPAVSNGVVYVGLGYNVYALNAKTGAKLWSYTTGGYVDSSPTVADGVVYVGSRDYNVYGLNASTGALLWSYRSGNEVYSSPAVANRVVYVGSNDFNVYALNASTGAKLWSYTTGNAIGSAPAVANGVAYVGSDDGSLYVFGLSRPEGERRRESPEAAPKRPELKTLRPDLSLKVSQPGATPSGAEL